MNFQEKVQRRKNRKAISPVLATVILIAITLIAAIAIAGFVFGLFGTFTATAQIQASVTSCVSTGGGTPHEVCNLILTNSGNANTYPTASCSLTYGGATYIGTTAPSGSGSPVNAGSTLPVTCTGNSGNPASAGVQVTGSVIMGNGANALFSATGS